MPPRIQPDEPVKIAERNQPETGLAIIIVTHNRTESLLGTINHLTSLEEKFRVVVVDNASDEDSAEILASRFPDVEVIRLEKNYGAVARNYGVGMVDQPYIAFCDDDSWWAYGSLSEAVRIFTEHSGLGLIMSKILVGPEERPDPCCESMERSPLPPQPELPGKPILGFIACGAVVRRSAFMSVGGFCQKFGTGGEEALLAIDLAKNGWRLSYIDEIISHHHPSSLRNLRAVSQQGIRNEIWTSWMRRPFSKCIKITGKYLMKAAVSREIFSAFMQAMGGMVWAIRKRDPVPAWLESQLEILDSTPDNC